MSVILSMISVIFSPISVILNPISVMFHTIFLIFSAIYNATFATFTYFIHFVAMSGNKSSALSYFFVNETKEEG